MSGTRHQENTKSQEHKATIRQVPIGLMRTPAENIVQRHFYKAQAERYAADFDFDKFGYPIVNFRDGHYWIVDGQHRIGALKLVGLGDESVECEVYDDLTDAQMAEIFLGRDDRRRVDNFAKFMISCTAGRVRETEVRRVVETAKLKVSRQKAEGCVGAVSALLRVHDAAGNGVLSQVLRTIRDSFAADTVAFDAVIVEGMGLFYNRFNGHTPEADMVTRLSAMRHGARGLLQRATTLQQQTGNPKVQCIAAVMVDIYNKNRVGRSRLPPWWKARTEEVAS